MFLKSTRPGKMEGKRFADGHPQREYITKEESSSPTILLYALMGSFVINIVDDRKVITVGTPGAFLQGDWPKNKLPEYITFETIMVDTICEINPSFNDMVV